MNDRGHKGVIEDHTITLSKGSGFFIFKPIFKMTEKEEVKEMMKKLICIAITVVFVLSQAGVAQAVFGIDGTAGPYVAEKDLTNVSIGTSLTVSLRNRSDNAAATKIDWVGLTTLTGAGWTIADQYVEVEYASFEVGWGVQLYTDNINAVDANHQFTGDPYDSNAGLPQPAGLVGNVQQDKALPMALLVSPVVVSDALLGVPEESGMGFSSGADYDDDATTMLYSNYPGIDALWYYLKDKGNTYASPNPAYDEVTNPDVAQYLYLTDWDTEGDSMATVVNSMGANSGAANQNETTYKLTANDNMRNDTQSPVRVYVAANFGPATKQMYKTDTLTLELYHQ